jgi:hypothetical protein
VTTLTDMINEVSMNLSGYTLQQDRATHITADVAATASTIAAPITLSLASTDSVGKGIVEIDEELFWVDNYDRVGNTATIAPYGRAYLGTTLAAHTEGTKVTIAPTFPRFTIKRAINDTINAIGASIFAASTTTITSNSAVSAFRLPSGTDPTLNISKILSIAYQALGSSKEWIPIRSYRFDGNATQLPLLAVRLYLSMTTSLRDVLFRWYMLLTQLLLLLMQMCLQHKLVCLSLAKT